MIKRLLSKINCHTISKSIVLIQICNNKKKDWIYATEKLIEEYILESFFFLILLNLLKFLKTYEKYNIQCKVIKLSFYLDIKEL